jgi:glycine hydroxymethyltransferase
MIVEVIDGVAAKGEEGDPAVESNVRNRVLELCRRFPIYS